MSNDQVAYWAYPGDGWHSVRPETGEGGPNKGKGPGVNMHVEGKAPGDKTDERKGPPNRAEGQLGKTPPKHAKK